MIDRSRARPAEIPDVDVPALSTDRRTRTLPKVFATLWPTERPAWWGDAIVLLGIAVALYVGARLAFGAPATVKGPGISLSPAVLAYYAALSLGRMTAAYVLSLAFTLVYGYKAAFSRRARRVLIPLLDVLQSVPILSFLPVVLLSLTAILPQKVAVELAAIILIFTSQVWNMTFAWFQSLRTVPRELQEAGRIFQLRGVLRLTTIELPFAAIALIWNSMLSWAGGWFFLMAAEIFTVGDRDFRLPGLGAYLSEAAAAGDGRAISLGIVTLIVLIVALDQLVWRPMLAWADRFKVDLVESSDAPRSWFYNALLASRLFALFRSRLRRLLDWMDERTQTIAAETTPTTGRATFRLLGRALVILAAFGLAYGTARAALMLGGVPWSEWGQIAVGTAATLLRVMAALAITLAWTIPLGVAIGFHPRLARWCQPIVQIAASVPATALFPVLLLALLHLAGGMNVAAIVLMLMGTQWYLLFNVIAGATAIPQDLKYSTALLGMGRIDRWRTLILPSLFPYLVTGAITSTGGAWNASIVAEYSTFGGRTVQTIGLGSIISRATADGRYSLLLAATLTMIVIVTLFNRLVWRRLYRLAEDRYRLE
jgi:NitT/TauT family transport system permease protein